MLGEILEKTRKSGPLVHCMVNLVTANDCANLALACGASPIMAEDLEEVEQVTSACDGLVLNLGTPSPRKIQALLLAGKTAKKLGKPVVFDPVGAGCSDFRKEAANEIIKQVRPDIIRGNASEIRTLLRGSLAHRGVDAEEVAERILWTWHSCWRGGRGLWWLSPGMWILLRMEPCPTGCAMGTP